MEIWVSITGHRGLYEVSNFGNVNSLEKIVTYKNGKVYKYEEKILKLNNSNGYKTVSLVKNKVKTTHMVHRLVAVAFISNPDNRPYVNHIDGNRSNNHYKNLEWSTNSENQLHSYSILGNRAVNGERNGRSKLDAVSVMKIRELSETGLTEKEISNMFGISKSLVGLIKNGKRWQHIKQQSFSMPCTVGWKEQSP